MDLIKPDGGGIGPLIHDPGGGLSQIAPPFSSEILLFESTVAGTSHVEGIEALSPQIVPGARLRFSREPDNMFDPRAIAVDLEPGQTDAPQSGTAVSASRRIGYVPQNKNETVSSLMDAGKLIYGVVTGMEVHGTWIRISMKVFMSD